MFAETISDIFTIAGFLQLLQWLVMFLEIVFVIVAFVIIRQVKLMNTSFKTPFAIFFKFLAYSQFFASMLLVALSLSTL